jgi:hypothetical protein
VAFEWDWTWFRRARSIRDQLVHGGASAVIHTDRHQFNLWLASERTGWINREPLLPLLRDLIVGLLAASDEVGALVAECTELPPDRASSRVFHGVMIPALNELVRVADDYARPSM